MMERKNRRPLLRLLFVALLFCTNLSLFAADYFWVGGSGNWTQTGRWATTTGGSTFHASPPGSADRVFFDANSFTAAGQTVTFDANATVAEINISGVLNSPTFNVGSRTVTTTGAFTHASGAMTWSHTNTLTVGGNVTLNAAATWNLSGRLETTSATPYTINTAGFLIPQLRLNGAGTATMTSALRATTFQLYQGGFVLNGQTWNVNLFDASSNGNTIRNINLTGTDTLYQTASFQVRASANTTFNIGSTVLKFTGAGNFDLFGGGKTYGDVVAVGTSSGAHSFRVFDNGNVIQDLIVNSVGSLDFQLFNSTQTIGTATFNYSRPSTLADYKPRIYFGASNSNIGPITFNGGGTASPVFQFPAGTCTYSDITINNAGVPNFATSIEFQGTNNSFRDFSFNTFGNWDLNVDFQSNNTFRTLSLPAGAKVNLNAGVTETITGSLVLGGTCAAPIYLQSKTDGTPATISMPGTATVTATYTGLQDITATGGATFSATNSMDLGGNTGWTIGAVASQTLYWVGGSGNWTDINHWRTTSGGSILPCGIPSAQDDVVFDLNSFTAGGTVTIDASIQGAYCRNMSWNGGWGGTPVLDLNTRALYISGNLDLDPAMSVGSTGRIHMIARDLGNTIASSGRTIPSISLNGTGGEWLLQDEMRVSAEIYMLNGTLRSNGQRVTANDFWAREAQSSAYTIDFTGTDTVTVARYWRIWTGAAFNLNMGTATLRKTSGAAHDLFMGGKTYNDIVITQTTSGSASVTVNDAFTARDISIARDGTGNWTFAGALTLRDFSIAYTQSASAAPNVIFSSANTFRNFNIQSTGVNRPVLQMTQSTTFSGSMTIGAGIEARLSSGRIFTAQQFVMNGTCDRPIILRNQSGGTTAHFLVQTSGSVAANYLLLSFSNASGGASFTAANTVNNGGNAGWVISTLPAKNLFWVGGSGNWSDPNHWALASGGAGNGCFIPLAQDNVFFDQNSFYANNQTVTLDAAGTCANFVWMGTTFNSTFAHGAQTLDVTGNFTLGSTMTYSGTGTLRCFRSVTINPTVNFTFNNWLNLSATTPGHTITIHPTIEKIFFGENTGSTNGRWKLGTDLNVRVNFFMVRGTFISNGYSIRAHEIHGWHANRRLMDFSGTDTVYVERNFFYFPFNTVPTSSLTINSTVIKFQPGNNAYDLNFWSGGYTYNDIVIDHPFTGQQSIFFSNNQATANIRNVRVNCAGPHIVSLADNVTYNDINITYTNSGSFFTPRVDISGTNNINDFSVTSKALPAPVVNLTNNNTFNNLSLAGPSMLVNLGSNRTQTVQQFHATGTPSSPMFIQGATPGVQGTISQASGLVCLNHVGMRDCRAIGGATFNAGSMSSNLGNNSGWSFTDCNAFYWVNGTGNWSDFGNHWATTSGGSVMHATLPAENDLVIFDYNSFNAPGQYVNINGPDPRALNMSWISVVNNPSIVGTGADMNIYGSLVFSPNMTVPWTGSWNFKGTTGNHTVNTAGIKVGQLAFVGPTSPTPAGTWTLRNSTNATTINLDQGTLITGGEEINVNYFQIRGSATRSLQLGASQVRVTDGAWDVQNSTGLTFSAGTSTITVNGTSSSNFFGRGLTYNVLAFSTTTTLNSTMTGSNTVAQLRIDPGVTLSLEAGSTQTLNTAIAAGLCNNLLTVQSTVPGTRARLSKPSGVITLTYAQLKDLEGTGGASWTATQTFDLGNNLNWTITGPVPLLVNVNTTPVACGVAPSGSATATVSGGLAPYVYAWSNSFTTQSISTLTPGSYTVTVSDATGCNGIATGVVGVTGAPDATFSIFPNSGCIAPGQSLAFIANSNNQNHLWSFGDGNFANGTSVNYAYAATGTYTVVHWATDATGCSSTSTQQVVISNCNQAPFAQCQNVTVTAGGSCQALVLPTAFDNGSGDFDGDPLSFAATPAGPYNAGAYNILLQVSDGQSVATCTANLFVLDGTPPTITCPGAISAVTTTTTCAATVTYTPPVGADNCTGATTQQTQGIPSGGTFPLGNTTNTFMVTDANGNTATCSFVVTVSDTTRPLIACPPNQFLAAGAGQCDAVATFTSPTGTDNCSGVSTAQTGGLASGANYPVGTTTNTFLATAANGQTATCSFDVVVADTTAPTIVCPAPMNVPAGAGSCGAIVTYNTPVGSDNCPGETTTQISGLASGNNFPGGTTTNTFVVVDAYNRSDTCSFTVFVADAQPPSITCPASIILPTDPGQCTAVANYTPPVGTDNCPGTTTTQVAGLGTGFSFGLGTTTCTFEATDANSLTDTCNFTVTVQDQEAPQAACQGITLYLDANGSASILPAAVNGNSTDNCGITTLSLGTSTFTCADMPQASTLLTLADAAGNIDTCSATVTLFDTLAPALQCRDTSFAMPSAGGATLTPAMVTLLATDGCGIDTAYLSQYTFACADTGLNAITLTVVDPSGNTSSCVAQVNAIPGTLSYQLWADSFSCGYNLSCDGATDGIARTAVVGGCLPYAYLWSTGDTTDTIAGLPAGTYHVTITDGIGRVAYDSVTIAAPPALVLGTAGVVPACAGQQTGTIDLSAIGGNACSPYTYIWSNGATTEDLSALPAGTYTVTVTDNQACSATHSVSVGSQALPVPDVGADTMICAESVLPLDPGTFSTYLWSTGATTGTIGVQAVGTYWVEVGDNIGCTGRDSITIGHRSVPSGFMTYSGLSPICIGDTATLTSAGAFNSHLWSTGATTASIRVAGMGGFISVVSKDAAGCEAKDTTYVNYLPYIAPQPVIQPGPDAYFCAGSSLTLDAGAGYFTFQWNNGWTGRILEVSAIGAYNVTVTNGFGCIGVSDPVNVTEAPQPVATIHLSNDTLWSDQIWSSYQWLRNGTPIPGAVLEWYVVPYSGNYSLLATDILGCDGQSNVIFHSPVDVAEDLVATYGIALYPNPARGEFNLDVVQPITRPLQVRVHDMYGRVVLERGLRSLVAEQAFDIGHLSAGPYLVEVETENKSRVVLRLVVQ